MKVCFFTLGCKVNQQETSAMMNIFENALTGRSTYQAPKERIPGLIQAVRRFGKAGMEGSPGSSAAEKHYE